MQLLAYSRKALVPSAALARVACGDLPTDLEPISLPADLEARTFWSTGNPTYAYPMLEIFNNGGFNGLAAVDAVERIVLVLPGWGTRVRRQGETQRATWSWWTTPRGSPSSTPPARSSA